MFALNIPQNVQNRLLYAILLELKDVNSKIGNSSTEEKTPLKTENKQVKTENRSIDEMSRRELLAYIRENNIDMGDNMYATWKNETLRSKLRRLA